MATFSLPGSSLGGLAMVLLAVQNRAKIAAIVSRITIVLLLILISPFVDYHILNPFYIACREMSSF
jgi:hypothetical protein